MSEWVVLELSPQAEEEDPEIVRSSIRHLLRDAEIFIPASVVQRGDDRRVEYLIDGYAFIKKTHPDERYFRLEGSKYITAIVTTPTGGSRSRRPACVQDSDIDKFRSQIKVQEDQGIDVEDLVVVTSGPYKNLKAIVIEDIPEQDAVQLHIQLRSKDSLVTLPRAFLRLQEKAPKPVYHNRLVRVQAHINALLALARWSPGKSFDHLFAEWSKLQRVMDVARPVGFLNTPLDPAALRVKGELFERMTLWFKGAHTLYPAVMGAEACLDPAPLAAAGQRFEHLTRWVGQTNRLATTILPLYSLPSPAELESKLVEYLWLDDLNDRFLAALTSIERTTQQMNSGGTQNLVIDGHNLAVRCATAPGLGELRDKRGRPTGAIVGFLNTLASLKKRFAGVNIYVTWDGSSQRRRAMFPDYKTGRGNPRAAFETSWLQENLPLFGVSQAWNSVEEADDAIATLVRGPLAGQSNVIFTTDRDLLQLVTASTCVLVPAVGAGKEKLFGPAEVEAEYGVPPDALPQLRALSGDTSDTIPGCPNCGLKTAGKLVKLYGSVEKLLSSNMAGLAKGLTANLRAAEKQVRLNIKLMTLITDLPLSFVAPDEDARAASAQLEDVDVKPERLLKTFFGGPAAAA